MESSYWTPQTARRWLLLQATTGPAQTAVDGGETGAVRDPRVVSLLLRIAEFDAGLLPDTLDRAQLERAIERKRGLARQIDEAAAEIEAAGGLVAIAARYLRASLIDHLGVAIRAWNPTPPPLRDGRPGATARFQRQVEQQRDHLAGPYELEAVRMYRALLRELPSSDEASPWAHHARAALRRLGEPVEG